MFYASLGVLLLWLILKSVGVIHTPFWLEYGIPIASVIFGALSVYKSILDSVHTIALNLATLTERVSQQGMEIHSLGTKFENTINRIDHLEKSK